MHSKGMPRPKTNRLGFFCTRVVFFTGPRNINQRGLSPHSTTVLSGLQPKEISASWYTDNAAESKNVFVLHSRLITARKPVTVTFYWKVLYHRKRWSFFNKLSEEFCEFCPVIFFSELYLSLLLDMAKSFLSKNWILYCNVWLIGDFVPI